MELIIRETSLGLEIELLPQNMKESMELLRYSANANSQKPEVFFSFRGDRPHCSIWLNKVKESVQVKSISPKNIKR